MSKGDIENTIRCYLDLPHDQKPIGWVGQLAREIAQAAEEDRAELMAVANNTRELWIQSREEATKLRAQVAMMAEALGFVRNAIGQAWKADRELRDRGGMLAEQFAQVIDALGTCSERAEQALSAAPKVWRIKGRTSKYYDLEVMAEGAPDEFRQLLIARGMFAPWDVIVFLPPGEQPTESEQEATDGTH